MWNQFSLLAVGLSHRSYYTNIAHLDHLQFHAGFWQIWPWHLCFELKICKGGILLSISWFILAQSLSIICSRITVAWFCAVNPNPYRKDQVGHRILRASRQYDRQQNVALDACLEANISNPSPRPSREHARKHDLLVSTAVTAPSRYAARWAATSVSVVSEMRNVTSQTAVACPFLYLLLPLNDVWISMVQYASWGRDLGAGSDIK